MKVHLFNTISKTIASVVTNNKDDKTIDAHMDTFFCENTQRPLTYNKNSNNNKHNNDDNSNNNNLTFGSSAMELSLDINSNIAFKPRGAIQESDHSDSCRTVDVNTTKMKRSSIDSCDSTQSDDSGFISSYCPDDEKNDDNDGSSSSDSGNVERDDSLSLKSHDWSFDYDDSNSNNRIYKFDNGDNKLSNCWKAWTKEPLPTLPMSRPRSRSLGSPPLSLSSSVGSGYFSETSVLSSKLSSYLPSLCSTYHNDNDDRLPASPGLSRPPTSPHGLSSNSAEWRRRRFRSRRTVTTATSQGISQRPRSDDEEEDEEEDGDLGHAHDLNNNRTRVEESYGNLFSRLPCGPWQLSDAFHKHGLVVLVVCVCYTFLFVLFMGTISMTWQIFTGCVGTEKLNELRNGLIDKRRHRRVVALMTTMPEHS